MSNYYTEAKRPKGKKFEKVLMMDNCYGHHLYGVKFPDGSVFREENCKFKGIDKKSTKMKTKKDVVLGQTNNWDLNNDLFLKCWTSSRGENKELIEYVKYLLSAQRKEIVEEIFKSKKTFGLVDINGNGGAILVKDLIDIIKKYEN